MSTNTSREQQREQSTLADAVMSARRPTKTREEYLQEKALEEARKLGQAEPELDEHGQMINPHIPAYIAKAPWYLSTGAPSLKHQRQKSAESSQEKFKWYDRRRGVRGRRAAAAATHYREGACTNCGAMTHGVKDCTERPRRRGAKVTNRDIERDEVVHEELELDFEGKRDRWNGFDPAEYRKVVERYREMEAQRRKIKSRQLDKRLSDMRTQKERTEMKSDAANDDDDDDDMEKKSGDKKKEKATTMMMDGFGSDDDSSDYASSDEDEDKIAEGMGMTTVANITDKRSQSVRNLRIREDTAKYLYNLDLDSAYYDPKTRSMRENPLASDEDAAYKGDSALLYSGEYARFAELQKFAFDAGERGQDVHFVAMPSQSEFLYKEYKTKRDRLKEKQRQQILESYGGEEHLVQPQQVGELVDDIGMETERYVEYSRSGRVISAKPKAVPKSKYEENVLLNGHTAVWGSFWSDGKWGYACCHAHDRGSTCRNATDVVLPSPVGASSSSPQQKPQLEKKEFAVPAPRPRQPNDPTTEQLQNMSEEDRKRDHDKIRQELMAELMKKKMLQQRRHEQEEEEEEEMQPRDDNRKDKRSRKRTSSSDSEFDSEKNAARESTGLTSGQATILDRKKRKYNSQQDVSSEVTQEEIDEHRSRKHDALDPMRDFL